MFFVMFYNSNLRRNLTVPDYEPEINSDKDIIKHNVDTLYVAVPDDLVEYYFGREEEILKRVLLAILCVT